MASASPKWCQVLCCAKGAIPWASTGDGARVTPPSSPTTKLRTFQRIHCSMCKSWIDVKTSVFTMGARINELTLSQGSGSGLGLAHRAPNSGEKIPVRPQRFTKLDNPQNKYHDQHGYSISSEQGLGCEELCGGCSCQNQCA